MCENALCNEMTQFNWTDRGLGIAFQWLDPSATSHSWEEASVSRQPAMQSPAGFSSC